METTLQALENRVLVLTPAGVDSLLISRALGSASVATDVADDIGQLCQKMQEGAGALIVAEEALTSEAINALAQALSAQAQWSDLPIIVLTGGGASDKQTERAARSREVLGNIALLERPVRPITLVSAAKTALRARARQYEIRDHLAQLTDVTQELGKSEQRYRSLISASTSLVWLADADGRARDNQPDWQAFTGQEPEEYAESGWLNAVHPGDRRQVQKIWREAVETGQVAESEFRLRRGDGNYRLVQWRAVPVRDASHGLLEWVATCTDIQDRTALQHALQNAEKFAIAGKLAGAIAHDINNPLEAVTNLVYLITTTSRDAGIRDYAAAAQKELSRISEITRQTLTFYRYSNQPEYVNVREIVEAVVNLLSKQLREKKISVNLKFGAVRPIRCYASEIRQVIANIVTNAIDALPQGGRLLVRTNTHTDWKNDSEKKGLRVTIADTGHGMKSEVRQKIFEPFFSTKQERGNGLGLWISADFIRKNDGRVTVKSSTKPGHSGTVFSLFFPCEDAPAK